MDLHTCAPYRYTRTWKHIARGTIQRNHGIIKRARLILIHCRLSPNNWCEPAGHFETAKLIFLSLFLDLHFRKYFSLFPLLRFVLFGSFSFYAPPVTGSFVLNFTCFKSFKARLNEKRRAFLRNRAECLREIFRGNDWRCFPDEDSLLQFSRSRGDGEAKEGERESVCTRERVKERMNVHARMERCVGSFTWNADRNTKMLCIARTRVYYYFFLMFVLLDKRKIEWKEKDCSCVIMFLFVYWRLNDQITFICSPGGWKGMWRELQLYYCLMLNIVIFTWSMNAGPWT